MSNRKKKPGRPSDFRKEYSEQAFKQCLTGKTDKELAEFFGISESTLNLWKKKHPAFSESLRRGKEVAHGEVANALYQAALGYERLVEKVVEGEVMVLKEWVPGDVGAMKYFMNNRGGGRWRNDPEVSVKINNETLQLPQDLIEAANKARKERMEKGLA